MMEDIHDIRPPVMVGMDPAVVRTGLWALAALLVIVFIFLAVRFWMKGRRPGPGPKKSLPDIPPFEAANTALDRLGAGPISDAKAFYFDLGRILKAYVGATYGFNSLEMTTQELGRQLRGGEGLPRDLKSGITGFQDLCDPFRYAPLTPDQDRVEKDLARGRALISAVEKTLVEKTEGA